jgi:hypothetical protein
MLPLPEHCVSFGVHVPEHAPIEHVPLMHGTAVPHAPAVQVWTPPFEEHWVLESAQTPQTPAPLQNGVDEGQGICAPQLPFVPHV